MSAAKTLKKATLNEIFLHGDNFKFSVIDFSSSKMKSKLIEVRKTQNEIREDTNFDVNELKKVIFVL